MKEYIKLIPAIVIISLLILAALVFFTKSMTAAPPVPEPLTWNEYNDLIAMYNHEIERQGGSVTLQNVSGENGIIKAMHALIRSRAVDARDAHIRGKALEMMEYDNFRKGLMQKVEAQF